MKRTRLIFIAILTLAVAAAAFAHHTEQHNHSVTGTVKMLHENHLAINTSENKHLTVHLTDKTVLTKGTRADLKPGTRVSVVLQDDGKTATSVEIAAAAKQQAGNQADKAVPVASNMVCMINNRSMANEQIPVEVDGKTYYGCCPMCKERLEKDEASRYAVDPVSGKKVDKAKAVIGALPGAAVLYFENEENLRKYNAGAK